VTLLRIWRRWSLRNSFSANAAFNAATNLVMSALGTISGIVAARLLGPHGRGELAAMQTWPVMIGYLALLGMGDALVFYSAREPERAGGYLASALAIALISGVPFVLVAYLAMPLVLAAQAPPIIAAARWYLLVVPLLALQGLPFCPLRGRGDFAAWNGLRVTPQVFWVVILAVAWFLGKRDPGALAFAYLGALALLVFMVGVVVKRRVPGPFWPQRTAVKPLLRYGLPCVLTTLPQILNLRMDQMLMAGLLPSTALGLYVVAVAWSNAVVPLLSAVAFAIFPEVASKVSESERAAALSRGTRFAALMALVTSLLLFIITPHGLVVVFGEKFKAATLAALILVPAGAIAGFNSVLEDGLRGLGRPASVMQAEFAGLIVTVVALALMLRHFGIVGASIASLIGYTTVTVGLLFHAYWTSGASPTDLMVPRLGDVIKWLTHVRVLARELAAGAGEG
jgi:O-antigen/teichoic acid export membrane protein